MYYRLKGKSDKLIEFQADIIKKIQEADINEDAFISFSAGGKRFLVSALEVAEIHDVPNITPLPAVKNWMIGVSSLSGEVCTVTDFSQFIGGSQIDVKSYRSKLIIPRWDTRTAILVDNVYHLVFTNTLKNSGVRGLNESWAGEMFVDLEGAEVGIEIGLQALLSDNNFLNANVTEDVAFSA